MQMSVLAIASTEFDKSSSQANPNAKKAADTNDLRDHCIRKNAQSNSIMLVHAFQKSERSKPLSSLIQPYSLFIRPDDILQLHMFISESYCVCLYRHMNRILRAVVKTSVAHLAVV